jgi:ribonuclease-3
LTTTRTADLETRLGHRFAAPALLEQALTHRSHGPENNERLEFLGDGVLGCAVADELYGRFPEVPEGKLTRLRAGLVREEALAEVGQRLGLRELLRLEPGTPVTTSILADAVEALFGAVFLDAGYAAARAAVLAAFGPLLDSLDAAGASKDAKTELQEALQARRRLLPEYRIVTVSGAAHQQSFEVECALPELGLSTSGSGTSRQRAEQQAAQAMLARLGPP